MKEFTDLNLSKELKEILKQCYSECNEESYITVNNFIYHFVLYFSNSKNSAVSTFLSSSYSKEELNKILEELKELWKDEGVVKRVTSEKLTIIDPELINLFIETDKEFKSKTVEAHNLFTTILHHKELYVNEIFRSNINENKNDIISDLVGLLKERVNGLDMLKKAEDMIKGMEKDKSDEDDFALFEESSPINSSNSDPNSVTPLLDRFSLDMTSRARSGKYDPVIGRDEIVDLVIEVLSKRKKGNAVLTGDAGVGKSAIIERLAQRIVSGDVPLKLRDKRICALDLNDLVAGTKFRGEYEERLQKVIKEVVSHPEVIVFIDEIHNLVGNGGSGGNGGADQILKPYLARGEFQCIGATTNEEFKKFIEKDAALNRRFTEINVTEPTAEETIKILKGIQKQNEEFHNVKYTNEVLDACVEWSGKYITGKNYPDKAIDLLDLSGALLELRSIKETNEQKDLRTKIQETIDAKIKAVTIDQDFEEGERLRAVEKSLKSQLDKTNVKLNKKNWPEVSLDNVAEAVSKISFIPVDKIAQTDMTKLKSMRKELSSRVIGQDEAIGVLSRAMQKNVLGLKDPHKPILSALFLGSTGTGKTYLTQMLADVFFGSDKKLIKINGGELKDETSVNKLVGSSAGYVGFDTFSPELLKVKKTPHCVLLIDEIEKANKAVYDIFLNILDEGYTILADGTRVDFTNTVIIFTSNIGTKELKNHTNIGFGTVENPDKENEKIVKNAMEKAFRPEFINRINSIVVFKELREKELMKIFDLELAKIKKQLLKSKYTFRASAELKKYIVGLCTEKMGARELQRNINKYIIEPVSECMLDTPDKFRYLVDIKDGKSIVKEEA